MADKNMNSITSSFDSSVILKSVHPKYREKLKALWEKFKPDMDMPVRPDGQSDQDYAAMIENMLNNYNSSASTRDTARSLWSEDQSSGTNLERGSRNPEQRSQTPQENSTRSAWAEADKPKPKDYGLDPAEVGNWSEADINRVFQEMVDSGKLDDDSMAVTSEKRKRILGELWRQRQ